MQIVLIMNVRRVEVEIKKVEKNDFNLLFWKKVLGGFNNYG